MGHPAHSTTVDAVAPRRLGLVGDYVALTKPKVQSLLLLTTVAAMEIAGDPSLGLIIATVVGGYLSAGGAGAVNHWYDRGMRVFFPVHRLNIAFGGAAVYNAIFDIEGVKEAAVVGKPDTVWGEIPVAFVTPKPGASLDETELIAFARSQTAHFKAPKTVIFCDLPKTATGKIEKHRLRAELQSNAVERNE